MTTRDVALWFIPALLVVILGGQLWRQYRIRKAIAKARFAQHGALRRMLK